MRDVYADNHRILVERCEILESVIDSFKLEIDFQCNVRKVSSIRSGGLVEFLVRIQEAYCIDALGDVAKFLDLLVCCRIIVRQDYDEKANLLPYTLVEFPFKGGFISSIDPLRPQVNWPTDFVFAKGFLKGGEEIWKSLAEITLVDLMVS